MNPRSVRWESGGLEHHFLEWDARGAANRPVALLVHGFQDAAATWDDVAVELAGAGLRVVVPDMRGFGDGPRVPPGGYYYFPDYVADVASLVSTHVKDAPLFLVGHSMGATVVTYYAGAFPERVSKLVLVDGVGPMDNPFDVAPVRMRRWIETVDRARANSAENRVQFASIDEATSRLVRNNPDVDRDVLARRAKQLVRAVEGGYAWSFDPLHQTTSPLPFYGKAYEEFVKLVACPALYVSGGAKGYHVPEEERRLALFTQLSRKTLEGGHALHWTMPRELAAALLEFWRG